MGRKNKRTAAGSTRPLPVSPSSSVVSSPQGDSAPTINAAPAGDDGVTRCAVDASPADGVVVVGDVLLCSGRDELGGAAEGRTNAVEETPANLLVTSAQGMGSSDAIATAVVADVPEGGVAMEPTAAEGGEPLVSDSSASRPEAAGMPASLGLAVEGSGPIPPTSAEAAAVESPPAAEVAAGSDGATLNGDVTAANIVDVGAAAAPPLLSTALEGSGINSGDAHHTALRGLLNKGPPSSFEGAVPSVIVDTDSVSDASDRDAACGGGDARDSRENGVGGGEEGARGAASPATAAVVDPSDSLPAMETDVRKEKRDKYDKKEKEKKKRRKGDEAAADDGDGVNLNAIVGTDAAVSPSADVLPTAAKEKRERKEKKEKRDRASDKAAAATTCTADCATAVIPQRSPSDTRPSTGATESSPTPSVRSIAASATAAAASPSTLSVRASSVVSNSAGAAASAPNGGGGGGEKDGRNWWALGKGVAAYLAVGWALSRLAKAKAAAKLQSD